MSSVYEEGMIATIQCNYMAINREQMFPEEILVRKLLAN